MFKLDRFGRGRLLCWLILLVIPFLAMGWAIGRYGPSLDDWAIFNRFLRGIFTSWDKGRPLMTYSHALIFLIAGGSVSVMQALCMLAEGVSAVSLFEVCRRVFRRWPGRDAAIIAFQVALVYVLYPSFTARYGIIWFQDSAARVLTLLLALLWVIACERDQPRIVIAAAVLSVITLLHKENAALLYVLFPAFLFIYGATPVQNRWRGATAVWYAALGMYLIWHVFIPRNLGGIAEVRPVDVGGLSAASLVRFLTESTYNIMLGAFQRAYIDDLAEMARRGESWLLPVTLAGAGLLVLTGWLTRKRDQKPGADPSPTLRGWLYAVLFGAAVMVLGILPYYLGYIHPTPIKGVFSRYTTIGMLGASLIWGMIAFLPVMLVRRWEASGSGGAGSVARLMQRYGGAALSGLVVAILLAGGLIRTYRAGHAYVDAWEIQRRYWQDIANLGVTFQPKMLFVMDSFPKNLDGAPLAGMSWGYENAIQLLFSNAPTTIEAINEGEVSHAVVLGDTLTITRYNETTAYPLNEVRVLYYDESTGNVELEPHLPLSWTSKPVYIFTGDNASPAVANKSAYFDQLLGPAAKPGACQTHVPVTTEDQAPADGIIEVVLYPQNQIIDRRSVSEGSKLDFTLAAPCGVWLRVYFTSEGDAGQLSTAWLVSQYGEDVEYGTAGSDVSPAYTTSIRTTLPAKPPH